jgi:hypothetical protein
MLAWFSHAPELIRLSLRADAFWGHFYLTDGFEYVTAFDGKWRKQLPDACRQLQ